MNKLYVIGLGPGHTDYILPIAQSRISECDLLIGGERNLESFSQFKGEKLRISKDLDAIVQLIKKALGNRQVGVIVSGDPGFYSMLDYLRNHFQENELEVIPGISSFQYLFAKIKKPWYPTSLLSVHGRRADYISSVKEGKEVTLLTDYQQSPDFIAKKLLEANLEQVELIVGENLSYPNERILKGPPEAILQGAPYQMAVVVILNE